MAAAIQRPVQNVCLKQGHKLTNFRLPDVIDPVNKLVVQRWEVRCSICTLTPEQIAKFRLQGATPRKQKAEENDATE